MPLTSKGNEILSKLEKEYGTEHGKSVLYAMKNSGKITGIDEMSEGSEGLKSYGDDKAWKDDSHHHEFEGKTGAEIEDKRKSHDDDDKHRDDDDKHRDAGMGLVHAKEEPTASEANYPKSMDSLDAMEANHFPNDPFGDKMPDGGFTWEKVMSPSQMKSGPLHVFKE